MQALEFSILNGIQESCRCAFLDAVLPFLSSLSDHGEIWIALALVLLLIPKTRRTGLVLALALDIGGLAVFKYAGFLVENFNAIFRTALTVPQIPLPIGISFYTFQALSGRRLARGCAGAALVREIPSVHLPLPAADRGADRALRRRGKAN